MTARRAPLDWLLTATAYRLPASSPNALLTADHLALMVELTVWEWHGTGEPTPEATTDRTSLRDALHRLPLDGLTRADAAARIQLTAKGAVL